MSLTTTHDRPIRLDGRVAVVTGAGNGLGRQYALALGRLGAKVVVNDLGGDVHGVGSDSTVAQTVVAEIRAAGGDAVADGHSVATPEGGAAIIDAAVQNYGRVDVLVSNAGILRNADVVDSEPSDIEKVLAVHLWGAFNVLRPAMRDMSSRDYGRVVMVSSGVAAFGNVGQAAYGAAKGGIWGLAKCAALEGEPHGVLVNTVMPVARTRMADGMDGKGNHHDSATHDALLQLIDPRAVAPLVAYLSSQECRVTGAAFSAGGGRFAQVFTGLSRGWVASNPNDASVDEIAAHFDDISDLSEYSVPDSLADEIGQLIRRLGSSGGSLA